VVDLILEDTIVLLEFAEGLQPILARLPSNRFILDAGAIADSLSCLLACDLPGSMMFVLIEPAGSPFLLGLVSLHLRFE